MHHTSQAARRDTATEQQMQLGGGMRMHLSGSHRRLEALGELLAQLVLGARMLLALGPEGGLEATALRCDGGGDSLVLVLGGLCHCFLHRCGAQCQCASDRRVGGRGLVHCTVRRSGASEREAARLAAGSTSSAGACWRTFRC